MLTSANLAMSARIRNLSLLWRRGLNYRNGSKDALKILIFFLEDSCFIILTMISYNSLIIQKLLNPK